MLKFFAGKKTRVFGVSMHFEAKSQKMKKKKKIPSSFIKI
jgi:hypothetical protein